MTRSPRDRAEASLLLAAVFLPWARGFLYDVFGLPRLVLASGGLFACALSCVVLGRSRRTALDGPLAAFAAATVVSALVSLDPWASWLGSHASYAWSALGLGLCALAFLLSAAQGEGFESRLGTALAFSTLPVSAYALLQWAGLDPWPPSAAYVLDKGRLIGPFGGPVPLGAYLAFCLPLCLGAAAEEKDVRLKMLGGAAAMLGVLAMAGTGARSAWLGAGAGAAVYGLRKGRHLPLYWIVAAVAGIAVALHRRPDDAARLETWRAAWNLFKERPWLGAGPNAFSALFRARLSPSLFSTGALSVREGQPDALNDWLQVSATGGALGAAAYGWLHWRAAAEGRRAGAATLGALAALFVQMKLNAAIWEAVFLASLLAGAAFSRESASRERCWAIALASCVLAGVVLRLGWADRLERSGLEARRRSLPREAAERLEAAIAARPGEVLYRMNLANLLWDVADALPDRGARRPLLDRAAAAALEGARRRPVDVNAWALLARAELLRAELGGEPRAAAARAALEEALRRDPYVPLDDLRSRIGALQGQK